MTAQRITKEPQFNLLQKITLFLLILAGMNFLSRDKLICVVACGIFLLLKVKFRVNKDVIFLLLLFAFWMIFAPSGNNPLFHILKAFGYPLACCAGLNFLSENDDQEKMEKKTYTVIVALSAGPFIHFLLNFITSIGKAVDRNTSDVWSGEPLSATIQAALSLMMLVVVITTLFTNTQFRNKLLSVIVLVGIFIYNLTLAGRTLFVMLLMIFVVNLLFLLVKGEKKGAKYKTLLIVAVIILLLSVLYNANIFGVQEAIESSNFYDRFFGQWGKDLDEDARMDNKMKYLDNFSKSLWGGVHLRSYYGYAHDILLDTYDEAGILALIAMILFLVSAVARLISCIRNRFLKFETQQLILAMYIALLVQFMIEPIMQGFSWMFLLFCFMHGLVTRLDQTSRRRATELNPNKN